MGRPFMTGRINYTPKAQQQQNDLDDRILGVVVRRAWLRLGGGVGDAEVVAIDAASDRMRTSSARPAVRK
jgi:hypothetical protein